MDWGLNLKFQFSLLFRNGFARSSNGFVSVFNPLISSEVIWYILLLGLESVRFLGSFSWVSSLHVVLSLSVVYATVDHLTQWSMLSRVAFLNSDYCYPRSITFSVSRFPLLSRSGWWREITRQLLWVSRVIGNEIIDNASLCLILIGSGNQTARHNDFNLTLLSVHYKNSVTEETGEAVIKH
jgi:hypothetical protein